MNTEVMSYALSKMDKSICQLGKKIAKVKQELEDGEKLKGLAMFSGSIGSLPLKVYVDQHLKAEIDGLAKKQASLEEMEKELQELEDLKASSPVLSGVVATKKGKK